ncbi:DUF5793 family protein [Natronomonas sp. LN261]|jgi:hypothetical protein|uniref:DUF5793 family protein n=1 Tax=Natronomonas sp. LN261 TaxID=2750669 RepID=UPI0015EEDD23|nr:DUF5793 family protein [Natronomonas sp. LN261]
MRRDYFTLEAAGVTADEPDQPVISVAYEGPTEEFEERLQRGGGRLDGEAVDVTYRLRDPLEAETPMGVFAVSDRVTGEYVLELNAEAEPIIAVTDAAGGEAESGQYRLVIETDDGTRLAAYDKSTLLVYDGDGELLRERSLIPSGVEI